MRALSKELTSDYGNVALVISTMATTFLWSVVATAYPLVA
jgi:hypothetical protein